VQERKQAEAALRLLNESLERRIEQRTQELSHANQGLKQSLAQLQLTQEQLVQNETLAALGSLVAGVAHELNTPIGNALLAASTLKANSAALLAELNSGRLRRSEFERLLLGQAQAADLIVGNLERGASLVGSFKQVAVDQAGLQRRRFGLREVTTEVVGLLVIGVKRNAFTVDIDLPDDLELEGYPGAYGQVITNLVQNAFVHGFDGRSQGCVRIRLIERTASDLVLQVEDDGKGIAVENLTQIFKPFFTTRLGQGGSGLGMHIVYTLVTGPLGGRVEVDSAPDAGCRVRLTLPLVAPVMA
jgi:signal transduction histidine kinase